MKLVKLYDKQGNKLETIGEIEFGDNVKITEICKEIELIKQEYPQINEIKITNIKT